MIKDRGLSFETQLEIEFLPPNNKKKKTLLGIELLTRLRGCLYEEKTTQQSEDLN